MATRRVGRDGQVPQAVDADAVARAAGTLSLVAEYLRLSAGEAEGQERAAMDELAMEASQAARGLAGNAEP